MYLFCLRLTLASIFILSLQSASTALAYAVDRSQAQNCKNCHQSAYQHWQQSDHAMAMAHPSKDAVKGDFQQRQVEHYGQKAFFFIENEQYKVTISYDDKVDTYPIKYTFGHFPLQQYLVATDSGKLQVLPFAWDARDTKQGGQRWYHNYSHEEIRPEDRLHWRQPLQNWNGMCADCHSDGLKRNYDADKNSFNTSFENINVGCLSCHGDMPKHDQRSKKHTPNNEVTAPSHPTGQWLRSVGEKTAHWQGPTRANSFMDNCFACHSLRSPLSDGIKANTPFLDQFMPRLPAAPAYHADGQIKEEVYVYGSFLQSKMHAKGVNCLDCHDKHTMKLKITGNGLCLQCHGAEVYNVKSHHQHNEDSTGAQCVNCHMPTNRYMGVDDRRDHSFKIPKPDLSVKFDTPNACTQCHTDKNNQWASDKLAQWHGKPKPLQKSKYYLMVLNSGQAITVADHLNIIADEKLDVISRASALQMLSFTTQQIDIERLKPYLRHTEDLIRLSAANAAVLLAPSDRALALGPLLTDKLKAIRVAAARSLASTALASEYMPAYTKAYNELVNANTISSWRGEGRANQGGLAIDTANFAEAEKAFKGAIIVDPYFATGYINLADLYRAQQRPQQVAAVLLNGMEHLPKSAPIKYAYGLHLVRTQQYVKATGFFEQAMQLEPTAEQYLYTYILSLDGQGEAKKALIKLQLLVKNYQAKGRLKELGLYLAQKNNNRKAYEGFLQL